MAALSSRTVVGSPLLGSRYDLLYRYDMFSLIPTRSGAPVRRIRGTDSGRRRTGPPSPYLGSMRVQKTSLLRSGTRVRDETRRGSGSDSIMVDSDEVSRFAWTGSVHLSLKSQQRFHLRPRPTSVHRLTLGVSFFRSQIFPDESRPPEEGPASAAESFDAKPTDAPEQQQQPQNDDSHPTVPSHFRNAASISSYERYGIPLGILVTIALFLVSDIGSGVDVVRQLVPADDVLFDVETDVILSASVFTSIASLWNTGSYALVVLVVIASISWPFVKLLLTLFAWMAPFHKNPKKRERLLTWLDLLGKWSFVDIVVFLEITVVFRSTVYLGGPLVEVFVVPRYGIFGFVCATMMSLILTQHVLRRHWSIIYRPVTEHEDAQRVALHTTIPRRTTWSILFLLVAATALLIAGIIVPVYRVSSAQGTAEQESVLFSIVQLGRELPFSSEDGSEGRMTWLAIVWFALSVAFPLLCIVLCGMLLYIPLCRRKLERLLFVSKVSFAWSGAEVFCLSTIFAISQVPKFGNGLIKSGCVSCYVVDAQLLPELGVLVAAAVTYMVASLWVFRLAHARVFQGRLGDGSPVATSLGSS